MSANPLLRLPTSPYASVFRAIVQTLQADATLRGAVQPTSWRVWEGTHADKQPVAITAAPGVRLTPDPGGEQWWSPDSAVGVLTVHVELYVRGTCVDDVSNLWWAIVRALYPMSQPAKLAIQAKLVAAGAETGLITFSKGAADLAADAGAAGAFFASGRMQIRVLSNYNA